MCVTNRVAKAALVPVLLFLLSISAVHAQDARGAVVGTVTDASGAVIPNAPVQVVHRSMGTTISLTTNDSGLYTANFLIPGPYQVTVEMPGFKKFVRDNIEVRVADRLTVDIRLEVGAAEQSVTVSAESSQLATENASMGSVVDGKRVQELPIPHGNPYFLIGLAAGVSFTRDPRLDRPFEPTHIVGYTMDGTRANRSDVTIDGAVATATANAGEVTASYVPPADLVQEFKVQTATFDASFGNTEGGVTNIVLKSGTNKLHGTMQYTNMTPGLFANDFFANKTGTERPDFYYHRWGATAGGPVFIPKVYDGRNKTFFMWGYEGIKEARPRNNGTPTVPTNEMKNGDFSALLNVGSNYQIYDPYTRQSVAGGRFQQNPFPNNIVPQSHFDPVGKKVLDQYFPTPLSRGNADFTQNYLRPDLMETANYYTHSIRIDQNFGHKNRLYGRYSWYDRTSDYNDFFDNASTGTLFAFKSNSFVIDDVHTLNATTVFNVRYGYNRFIRFTDGKAENIGFDLTSLGFPAQYNDLISPDIRRFPRFEMTGYQNTAQGGENRPNDTHSINATLSKMLRTHSIKFGVEGRSYRETDVFFANEQTGRFIFDATFTRGPLDNSPTAPGSIGQSVAAMLMGLPTSGSYVRFADSYAEQSVSWGAFVHDDWKVTNRLTLNLGLRWENDGPLTERYNRSVRNFDMSYVQPFDEAARAAYANSPIAEVPVSSFKSTGGLTFAGIGGEPRSLYNTPRTNFMPRIGFAYRLGESGNTVLRGGYGTFYGFLGQRRGDVIQTGFSRNTPFVPTQDNGLTFLNKLSNPFPNGILAPIGAGQSYQTSVGQSVTFFDEEPKRPLMQRWQFSVQREMGGFLFDLGYVGNKGSDIEISQNLNVTPQKYLSTLGTRDNANIAYLTQNFPNPYRGLLPEGASGTFTGANLSRERLLRPFPEFDAVNHSRFDGETWYHSLQFNVEKRFSKGYTIQANYTWSKYLQATETLQADDLAPTRVISDLDRPHRFTTSGIWELPFGKGKMIAGDVNRVANAIIGGWQLGGVYTWQSGAPINWGNSIFYGADPSVINLPAGERTVERWFNTAAGFERNSTLQLASNIRYFPLRFSSIRAHNINNWDLSIIKNNKIGESMNLQLKGEFLNAMNHPQFPAPNTAPAETAFGQINASNQANYPRRIQLQARFVF